MLEISFTDQVAHTWAVRYSRQGSSETESAERWERRKGAHKYQSLKLTDQKHASPEHQDTQRCSKKGIGFPFLKYRQICDSNG